MRYCRTIRQLILAAVVCATPALVASQDAPQDPEPLFKSESDLIVLHVNVFDGRSDAVPGLPQEAFQVFEENQRQEISFFSNMDLPVTVGLVLDNSGSMIARHRLVTTGGAAFARSSHPEDELFTIHFNEHVQFGLPDGVPFTNLQSLLTAALGRFRAGGRTALHDAVIAGLNHLEFGSYQKRVLVVLSDGEDNASRHSEDEMIEHAKRSNALVYTVSNANRRTLMSGNPGVLRKLADTSGGVAYFPDSDDDVIEDFDEIAQNIRRGYTIGYVPTNPAHDGSFRRVKVTVRVPGRRNLRVRSRDGYRTPVHPDAR